MTYLEHLKENEFVYYVYRSDLGIFGIETDNKEYFVVTEESYQVPKEFSSKKKYDWSTDIIVTTDEGKFTIIQSKEWFNMTLKSDINAWIYSCLNKKYIIKETVKILMTLDILNLRKQIDTFSEIYLPHASYLIENNQFDEAKIVLYKFINYVNLVNQIIENHKIVNYQTSKLVYDKLIQTENSLESIINEFLTQNQKPLQLLFKTTDGLLKEDKLNRIRKQYDNKNS